MTLTTQQETTRQTDGRFKKGVSGNPGGRAQMPESVRKAFRTEAKKSLPLLVAMVHGRAPFKAISDCDRHKAITTLMDRAWGRAEQAVDLTSGGEAMSVAVTIYDTTKIGPSDEH